MHINLHNYLYAMSFKGFQLCTAMLILLFLWDNVLLTATYLTNRNRNHLQRKNFAWQKSKIRPIVIKKSLEATVCIVKKQMYQHCTLRGTRRYSLFYNRLSHKMVAIFNFYKDQFLEKKKVMSTLELILNRVLNIFKIEFYHSPKIRICV